MKAENLATIFDLFAQVDPKAEGVEGGLGIGLALVKGLVERQGGTIHARSQGLRRGSDFVVCLPLAASLPLMDEGAQSVLPADASEESRRQVLVVDDNVDAAESLAMMLQADHHAVRTAHNGEDALRLAGEQNPDVMVLDLGMPKMSGYEVARRVRKKSWGRRPILIACSGWGQPEDRKLSKESGFDHHLVKPVNAAVLLRLVRDSASRDPD